MLAPHVPAYHCFLLHLAGSGSTISGRNYGDASLRGVICMQVQAPNGNLMQLLAAANEQLQRPSCQASVPGAPTLTGPPINAPAPGLLAPAHSGGCCTGAPLFQACLSQHSWKELCIARVFDKHVGGCTTPCVQAHCWLDSYRALLAALKQHLCPVGDHCAQGSQERQSAPPHHRLQDRQARAAPCSQSCL